MPDGSEFTFDNKKTEPTGVGVPIDNDSQRSTISSATNNILAEGTKNNTKFSLSDSQGRELTKEQQEHFKDSQARDDNGSLTTVYHGTNNAGFTVFNRNVNFYADSKEVAGTYTNKDGLYGLIMHQFCRIVQLIFAPCANIILKSSTGILTIPSSVVTLS